MRDDGLIVAQSACHRCCRHFLSTKLRRQRAIVDRRVGMLYQPRQQADEHGAALRFFKFLNQNGNRRGGGDFSQVQAPYAVGNDEQITVGARLVA